MTTLEIQERRRLVGWLDKSVMTMDLDALRMIACMAAIRVMNEDELDKVQKLVKTKLKKRTKV